MDVYGNAIVPHLQGSFQHSKYAEGEKARLMNRQSQPNLVGMAQGQTIWWFHHSKLMLIVINAGCQLMVFVVL